MKLKLTTEQYDFLKQHLSTEHNDLFRYFLNSKNLMFELDEETAINVRDWVGEMMQKVGFDSNYELKKDGIILAELEDLLYE
jgi:hypothetical protein